MFDKLAMREGNQFYIVKEDAVDKAQNELGVVFPQELRKFYKEIGYGFLESKSYNFNRIMDPGSICEFRLRTGQFEDDSALNLYEAYERDTLIFFEVCESFYLGIGFSQNNNGKIYYKKEKIADSLEDFLIKYQADENYFF